MEFRLTKIAGVIEIFPKVFKDDRGLFYESWSKEIYRKLGLEDEFVQDNISFSKKNTLRGLHFQNSSEAQGQLVSIVSGAVFDVCVDIRPESKTFGKYVSFELDSEKNAAQIYMPPGIAHGFCVLSEQAIMHYKCTKYYSAKHDSGLAWNDLELNITWPKINPIISEKDSKNMSFKRFKSEICQKN